MKREKKINSNETKARRELTHEQTKRGATMMYRQEEDTGLWDRYEKIYSSIQRKYSSGQKTYEWFKRVLPRVQRAFINMRGEV